MNRPFRPIKRSVLFFALLLSGCTGGPDNGDALIAKQRPEERLADHHMVAAAHPLAVEAGLNVLRRGGNAMDAAVTVQMVLGFVEAPESGIGGGGFLMYRDGTTGTLYAYDGRETAPASAQADRFTLLGLPLPLWATIPSGRAVGVPGLLAMLEAAHDMHGTLDWSDLLEPAISLARDGITMPERLREQVRRDPSLWLFGDMRRQFVAQARGDEPRLRNAELAETLAALATHGAQHLYRGEIADTIVERVHQRRWWRGDLSLTDLASYRPVEREPVCGAYREWTVCGPPPPSSGGVALLQILGALERFPLADLGADSVVALHLIAEASRLAFADREHHIGDPDHVKVPTNALIDRDYIDARAELIDPARAMAHARPGAPGERTTIGAGGHTIQEERAGTSHFSIVDAAGNLVSLTTSVEAPFGSRMMSNGFVLNNQLTDFSFVPEQGDRPHPNAVAGGKRPRSSMSPVIVLDARGDTRLVIGSRGGSRIIGHVARTLIAVLDWNLDIQDAIALPGFVDRGRGLELEQHTPIVRHRAALEALGHEVRVTRMTSGLHGIERVDGRWRGGADPRLDGVARGD